MWRDGETAGRVARDVHTRRENSQLREKEKMKKSNSEKTNSEKHSEQKHKIECSKR
jgi:hypothetical protein